MTRTKRIVMTFACAIGILLSPNAVFANSILSEEELDTYSLNSIYFYDNCGGGGSNGGGICGSNQNYAGEQVFTDAQMDAIEANQPFYEKAASKYGFPWQLIAVIHMREHGLARSNPGNGQGVYQFASAARRASCKGGNFSPGAISDEQFQIQTDCVADAIKNSYGSGLDLNTDDGVKRMFFNYNGTAGVYKQQALALGFSQKEAENGEGSPYVMNRYDAKREPSSTWGQIKTDGGSISYPANNDFGAFVYYKAISCGSGSGSSSGDLPSCGGGDVKDSKNINATAVALAWPEGTPEKDYFYKQTNGKKGRVVYDKKLYSDLAKDSGGPTEAFKEALDEVFPNLGGNPCSKVGAACDVFAGTVVRYSGYDKKFPHALGKVLNHARNSDLWEVISFNGDKEKVKGGDLLIRSSGHIAVAVRDEDDKLWVAQGSLCWHWGYISDASVKDYQYIVRATEANNSTAGVSVKDGVANSNSAGKTTKKGQGNGDIGASALELAWPFGTDKDTYKSKATDKFAKYFEEISSDKNDTHGGRSCDRFVSTVVKYAGVDDDIIKPGGVFRNAPGIQEYLAESDLWEEVQMKNPKSTTEYQDGDVIAFGNGSISHVGIYVEDGGKGYIAQASYGGSGNSAYYGVVKDTNNITSSYFSTVKVYRNKNNKNATVDCDVCAGEDGEGGGGGNGKVPLKDGGVSLDEAKKIMEIYRGYAGANNLGGDEAVARKYYIKAGCHNNLFLNCVSFVKYFINRYTTKTWTNGLTGNGNTTYKHAANDLGLKTGNTPKPYAIFSDDSYDPGHTGIVLAVDSKKGTMMTGEAACMSYSTPRAAYEYIGVKVNVPVKKYHLYAYLDEYVKTGD